MRIFKAISTKKDETVKKASIVIRDSIPAIPDKCEK